MRSFPIKKVEAEALLKTGEAVRVERFINDPVIEVKEVVKETTVLKEEFTKPNNIVNFEDKFKAKQEEKEFHNAVNHFKNNILPKMTYEETKELTKLALSKGNFEEELLKIALRVILEEEQQKVKF